ncbi:MAG TPA: T9SS type A sorting domain-containing protein [Cytophagaceae bacterium]
MKTKCLFLILSIFLTVRATAQWGVVPPGWGDFAIGLTDDGTKVPIISDAIAAGTDLHYRVRYINEGVDTTTNWYSYWPSGGIVTNFINASNSLNMRAAFNIYMLQEEGEATAAINNMGNLNFMKLYFWNIRNVAQKANGHKAAFIMEPDTWGYLIKKCYGDGPLETSGTGDPSIRPDLVFCHVNDLGYPYLADLPNTMAGMAQGIIRTIRTYAPDAYVGFHVNHWAAWANGSDGTYAPDGNKGLPYWSKNNIDYAVNFQKNWYLELLGGPASCDRGDFLVVEKYGLDAGGRLPWDGYFYGDAQNANWVYFCREMGKAMNLPLLGWQIPVGHMGLPNTVNRYEDTFMEYFFAHKEDFYCAGFIGLFMGPGVGVSTMYSNTPGVGDDGWLFSNLRSNLDPTRPVNMDIKNTCGATVAATPGCSLPVKLIDFTASSHNDIVSLNWVTTAEKELSMYVVQSSTDAVSFTDLGVVQPGNRYEVLNTYTYKDFISNSNNRYYRLKMLNLDGTFEYSNIISASRNTLLHLYPNPASGALYIRSNETGRYNFYLYDNVGTKVLEQLILPESSSVNIAHLPSSIYYYKFVDATGNVVQSGKVRVE